MSPQGIRKGCARFVLILFVVSLLSLSPSAMAPALADDDRQPPPARIDDGRQRDAQRARVALEEQRRRVELERAERSRKDAETWRLAKKEAERRTSEVALKATNRGKKKAPAPIIPAGLTGHVVNLAACASSQPAEALVPSGSPVLITAAGWGSTNRGLVQAFIQSVVVEASVDGQPIANPSQYFVGPVQENHPTLGLIWVANWVYPLTAPLSSPVLVRVRMTLSHQMVDLLNFDEEGKPIKRPAGSSVEFSCALQPALAVTGRITGEGVALADGEAIIQSTTGDRHVVAGTDANGEFSALVAPGTYTVFFHSLTGPWLGEFWQDTPNFFEATRITLSFGTAPPRLVADLTRGVFLSGRVTAADTGTGVAGVGVHTQPVACCEFLGGLTGVDGRYRFAVRKNTNVRVEFFVPPGPVPYLSEFWNDRRSFAEADILSIGTADVAGIDAALERGVFIRGRMTDEATGLAVRGNVSAARVDAPCCQNFFAAANPDGTYALAVPSNSQIIVGFFPPSGDPSTDIAYIPVYWDGKRSFGEADRIAVGTTDVMGIDGAFPRGVWLTGRVTEAGTTTPVEFVTVVAQSSGCCEMFFAFTAPNGEYVMAVPRNTDLRVGFFPPSPYVLEWYRDRASFADADIVHVGTANVGGIDGTLERGVFVRGRVTDAQSGAGLAGTNVSARQVGGSGFDNFFGGTDENGDYVLTVRKNITIKVFFAPPAHPTIAYVGQWYSGKATFETADPVVIGTADVGGINAAIERAVFLSGRVTSAETGQGLGGVNVNAQVAGVVCCEVFFAVTDSQGHYRVVVRKNITVKVGFFPSSAGSSVYLGQWYRGRASFSEADLVPVGTESVTGIDAALEAGVLVSGRITDELDGTGLAFASMFAQHADGSCCEFFSAGADASGNYALVVRRNVRLKIRFFPPFASSTPYLAEWWNNKASFDDADELAVGITNISGIDGSLARGVFVRGRVTDAATGLGLQGASVNGYVDPCCDNFFTSTDASGDYRLAVRQNIVLRIQFFPPFGSELVSEFYNDKPHFDVADLINVGSTEVTGIDAALGRGLSISGRVVDEAGAPASRVSVNVHTAVCCGFVGGDMTDGNGEYSVTVAPGDYKVGFFPGDDFDLLSEYWNDKPGFDQADVIVVSSSRSGIDAVLARGTRVRGRVTNEATGAGVPNVGVNGLRLNASMFCCEGFFFASTRADGSWSAVARPGNYKIAFFPPSASGLLLEYYADKAHFGIADIVSIGTSPVEGIDATLRPGVDVSGRVTDAATGSGLGNVQVDLYATDGSGFWFGSTNTSGLYSVTVPQNITIKVVFTALTATPYDRQWYDGKPIEADADLIAVGTTDVTGIDAAMRPSTMAPIMIDARVVNNVATTDFTEPGDSFVMAFSKQMDRFTSGDALTIEDQDGTTFTLSCGGNATCGWDFTDTKMTVTVASAIPAPPIGTVGAGTTIGMQIPFSVTALAGVTDIPFHAVDLAGSPDTLVDYE